MRYEQISDPRQDQCRFRRRHAEQAAEQAEILQPFFDSFNIINHEFVFTSGIDFTVSVLSAENDEAIEAMVNIVYSTGNFANIAWSRAYDADAYKEVFEHGHTVWVSMRSDAGGGIDVLPDDHLHCWHRRSAID